MKIKKLKIKKKSWFMIGIIAGIITLINFFVPDPLPFIDEVIGTIIAVYGIYRGK